MIHLCDYGFCGDDDDDGNGYDDGDEDDDDHHHRHNHDDNYDYSGNDYCDDGFCGDDDDDDKTLMMTLPKPFWSLIFSSRTILIAIANLKKGLIFENSYVAAADDDGIDDNGDVDDETNLFKSEARPFSSTTAFTLPSTWILAPSSSHHHHHPLAPSHHQ